MSISKKYQKVSANMSKECKEKKKVHNKQKLFNTRRTNIMKE